MHTSARRPLPRATAAQRGAALLIAMLIVVLVASLAAAASWQQWSAIQAEGDSRAQVQSKWLISGAVDWSRIILYLDKRTSSTDDLNEPWALPLAEARLSTFLTADENASSNANADMTQAFFSGGMSDLQGRLNLTNLVKNNEVDPVAVQQFERLFTSLNLPTQQVNSLAQNYWASLQKDGSSAEATTAAGTTTANPATAPLTPLCTAQLGWLGLSPETIAAIGPFVTILPQRTKLNLNTAPERVLWAALPNADESLASKLVNLRQTQPFETIEKAQAAAGQFPLDADILDTSTQYFLVHGAMRLDTLETTDELVLERNGTRIRTVRRECPLPEATAL